MGDEWVRGRSRTKVYTEIACSIRLVACWSGRDERQTDDYDGYDGLTAICMNFARYDILIPTILFYMQNSS
jgi:hypothetical protein